jgi:hypothetical protein
VQDRKGSANQRLKGRGDEIVDRNGKRYALVKRFFSEVRVKNHPQHQNCGSHESCDHLVTHFR